MKKVICSFVIAFIMGLSANIFAQKSTAYLTEKTVKKEVDERTAIVSFQLSNIADEQSKQKYQDSFKTYKGVQEVRATLQADNMASFSIKMLKKGTVEALQNMFLAAGIETVNIDGTTVETKEMANHIKAHKEKK
jgi:uncharacterized membrane protein YraQ (UPF0718 family)